MAHAPLLRTNTTPVFQSHPNGAGGLSQQSMSSGAPRTSQLSGSTAYAGSSTSLTSLNSDMTVVANGPVVATSNIINQKADASRSLYQICVSLKQRLAQVPGFDQFLQNLDPTDPVDPLWNLFRTGFPLLLIYNTLRPVEPLIVDEPNASDAKKSKIAIFKFVEACMKDPEVPMTESLVIADLMGNDTSGFVTQVVNHVLDLAEQRGCLLQLQPYPDGEPTDTNGNSKMTYRDHVVKELVDTERKYVQDLENLHDLKKTLEQKGVIPGDVVHQIFLNINFILDFQRRFLIRVETTNSMPAAAQRWGQPFITHEEFFSIYQPFIANQRKAAQIANQVFEQIRQSDHPVAADFNTLDGFLLKPMQRLVKYPLLLKDLAKKTEDPDIKEDLLLGCEAAERVLQKANEAVNRDLLDDALEELIVRVDDWKSHKIESFGKLLLHGVYGVITGKSDQEKDYEIYLFECILLCCKEISPNKSKDKKDRARLQGPKTRNKNAKLQLKGRIFMANVTDVVSLSKPGSHSVQIWWKGDPGVENFTIKFLTEEMMKKWATGLETQRKENAPRLATSPDDNPTDFAWTRDQAGELENPYLQQGDDDDEDYGPATAPAQFPMPTPTFGGAIPRTASSSNLRDMRQRSVTAETSQSLASIARAPPPRFPPAMPPAALSLQTQNSMTVPSPGVRGGDSYFSPTGDSPASSRTSTTSGVFPPTSYPFPKAGTPQPGWDENNRYTAPAMPRAPSRDGTPPNAYGASARNLRGPSLPPMSTQNINGNPQQQQRSRSYSTPDVNAQGQRRQPSQGNIPAVPGIPMHLHPAHDSSIPRSQTGSPRNDAQAPIRTSTQSPGTQGQRLHKHSGSVGGTMAQFPTQPIYPRQATPGPPTSSNGLRVDPAVANSRTVSPSLGTGTMSQGMIAHHGMIPQGMMPQVTSYVPPQSNPLASPDVAIPTQLKVRVTCDTGNYVTLVVAFNITYQSLVDRIDAKLARITSSSIAQGMLKLRYQDEDEDFVTIESDDDIQIAFTEFRDSMKNAYNAGVGEIELFCVGHLAP
ncbi:guanine-nucleotide dissociation stimulator [Trichoderma cornu-damae]|uniref:Guanine-nucleotide dissociation stimulator n=1 Tax=Trichoderma cornu-damae TaxID=654480 RepID=A0A9P8TRG3_9HYPO|nr:guanine-nucleotide dissociation stimulator [Trichoderma cornu-damae]